MGSVQQCKRGRRHRCFGKVANLLCSRGFRRKQANRIIFLTTSCFALSCVTWVENLFDTFKGLKLSDAEAVENIIKIASLLPPGSSLETKHFLEGARIVAGFLLEAHKNCELRSELFDYDGFV
jgi:hypothetical protein